MFTFNKQAYDSKVIKIKKATFLTLGRQLFATPGAPDAGSSCHFRLSSLFLRDTEVITINAFFHKKRAPFSDRYKNSKHE